MEAVMESTTVRKEHVAVNVQMPANPSYVDTMGSRRVAYYKAIQSSEKYTVQARLQRLRQLDDDDL